MRHWWVLFCLLVLGCGEKQVRPILSTETPISIIPTIVPTEVVTPNSDAISTGTAESASQTRFTLKIWVPSLFSPFGDRVASQQFQSQLDLFDRTHPEVKLDVQLKTVAGQGGIVNYLQTGHTIAPTALPDIALLPNDVLPMLAKEKLIFPLDAFVGDELLRLDDLYAASVSMGKVEELLYGYPVGLSDYFHIAYNRTAISETFPIHWGDLLGNQSMKMVLSADSNVLSSLLLQLYLSNNVSLIKNGVVDLQSGPLTKSFGYLSSGVTSKFLVAESFSLPTKEDAWDNYVRGEGSLTIVDAAQFFMRREQNTDIGFAAIPGIEDSAPPLVTGWLWVITTPDSARQALSAELIAHLTGEQYLGQWSEKIPILPANANAFNYWKPNEYTQFLKQELFRAHTIPPSLDMRQRTDLAASVTMIFNDPTLNAPNLTQKALATLFPK